MTLEITHGASRYSYCIDPDNPCIILRRENKHNARWYWYGKRDTPQEAKRTLLQLQAEHRKPEQEQEP
jgi:hypothetical protein